MSDNFMQFYMLTPACVGVRVVSPMVTNQLICVKYNYWSCLIELHPKAFHTFVYYAICCGQFLQPALFRLISVHFGSFVMCSKSKIFQKENMTRKRSLQPVEFVVFQWHRDTIRPGSRTKIVCFQGCMAIGFIMQINFCFKIVSKFQGYFTNY